MKIRSISAWRANLVLFSLLTCIVGVPFAVVALAFNLGNAGTPDLGYRVSVLALAFVLFWLLRWRARRAFELAHRERWAEISEQTDFKVRISRHCPRAWLVQLHVELRGGALSDLESH
jgi:hypothetical protein